MYCMVNAFRQTMRKIKPERFLVIKNNLNWKTVRKKEYSFQSIIINEYIF